MSAAEEPEPCRTCQEFDLEEAVARSERDGSRETDARVLRRRHVEAEHGEPQPDTATAAFVRGATDTEQPAVS
ncbi:hypothetical protein [Streptomyces sp. SID7909]|uniref:hypothetical protein n=1 Tax=Streptomyces sp. SID7909 TaxID=2706092 RepID=UPI0013B97684|nr:hypothetical protein [Streptomyces sp. SID7909]NEC07639.1 hypothetical protein [Streptomyces sp. SID7909]